jgi:sulfite reductase (ferredoxin)
MSTPRAQASEVLDLRGVPCPTNAARALIKIATMSEGEVLEVWLDEGEPMENLPPALAEESHEVFEPLKLEGSAWSVLVRVGY